VQVCANFGRQLEVLIYKRLKYTGKLFVFLREQKHQIINEARCQGLVALYHDHPRGKPAVQPALLATATLLQSYEQKLDAAVVLESVFSRR